LAPGESTGLYVTLDTLGSGGTVTKRVEVESSDRQVPTPWCGREAHIAPRNETSPTGAPLPLRPRHLSPRLAEKTTRSPLVLLALGTLVRAAVSLPRTDLTGLHRVDTQAQTELDEPLCRIQLGLGQTTLLEPR